MVPGLVTFAWFTPERTRNIDVFCEQLCGIAHFAMRGKVIVEALTAHDARLCNYPTFAQSSPHVPGDATAGEALVAACAACHGSQAKSNPALHAPKLSGQGDWCLRRELKYSKQGVRRAHDKDVHGRTMAPMAATRRVTTFAAMSTLCACPAASKCVK